MTFILSIFLCFALAFSGTGALPAEPETATIWTIRNVCLDTGDETFTLDPELRLTTAVGAEKVDMHFEIGSGESTLLPISAELTPDAFLFTLSNGGRAYSLSDEEFMNLAHIDEEDLRILNIVGDFFISYGALLGLVTGDEEQAAAYSQAVLDAVLEACGSEIETVEIEHNGETMEAQQAEIILTFDAAFKLMDELRGCGIDAMEQLMDAVLALCNLEAETEYADFAALAGEIDEDIDFSMPLTITIAEDGDVAYGLVECDYDMEAVSMRMREEINYDGTYTTVDMTMDMTGIEPNDTSASYVISAQMAGPMNAPEAIHMDYDIVITSDVSVVYEAEDVNDLPANADNVEKTYVDQNEIQMTLDFVADDGLSNAQFAVNFQEIFDDEVLSSGIFYITTAERRETNGSVTADVTLGLLAEDEEFGLTFELNRAEAAPVDYFAGLDLYEFSEEGLDSDSDMPSALQAALMADASQLTLDVIQLSSDPSIQALMNMGLAEEATIAD